MNPLAEKAIAMVLEYEGGYQCDRDDSGNWTGGAPGAGKLRGTNFGISAASYPDIDIERLDCAGAEQIYFRDFWMPMRCDLLPAPVSVCLLDAAVMSGQSRAVRWLQKTLDLISDGQVGRQTINAAMRCKDIPVLLTDFTQMRKTFFSGCREYQRFGAGWNARADRTLAKALETSCN